MVVFLTCLSVIAIASNGIKIGGGPYYMISRSLGKEVGIAIGIILFISLCFSTTIFISGSILVLTTLIPAMKFPTNAYDTRIYGSILLCIVSMSLFMNNKQMPVSYTHLTLPTTPYV